MNEQTQLHLQKIHQARGYMRERGIDLTLIRDRGAGDPCVPLLLGVRTAGDAFYLLGLERLVALVGSDDEAAVRATTLFDEVVVYEDDPGEALVEQVRRINPALIALNLSRTNHLSDGLTVGSYRSLLRMLGEPWRDRIVSAEEYVQKLRSIKSEQEVAYIRRAIEITLEIYDEVFAATRSGMTEIEVGELFVAGMRARGVVNGITRDLSPPIVMKHRIAHRPPGEGVIEPGDYLIIDFSVDYMGYCSDIARTAYVLKPGETQASAEMQRAFRTVREATDRAIELLKPGAVGTDVDQAARRYVLDHGYPNIFHSVGHEVGRDVHDGGVRLGPNPDGKRADVLGRVEAGMVFAVEPTILYEEGPAIISEDDYLVTNEGAVLLGEPQRELVLLR